MFWVRPNYGPKGLTGLDFGPPTQINQCMSPLCSAWHLCKWVYLNACEHMDQSLNDKKEGGKGPQKKPQKQKRREKEWINSGTITRPSRWTSITKTHTDVKETLWKVEILTLLPFTNTISLLQGQLEIIDINPQYS